MDDVKDEGEMASKEKTSIWDEGKDMDLKSKGVIIVNIIYDFKNRI